MNRQMKFSFIKFLVLAFSISCSSPKGDEASIKNAQGVDDTSVPDNIPTEIRTAIKPTDLAGRIFEVGSKSDFTDSCSFYFECDCCYGNLIFNSDSTFYNEDICVADLTMTIGKYSIWENVLTLQYSGKYVSRIYNWDYDTDTTVTQYFYKDTVLQPVTKKYLAYSCNSKMLFKNDEPADEIMLESRNDNTDSFFIWDDKSLLDKLKKDIKK